MGYAAIFFLILGFGMGTAFRVRVLLLFLAVLLLASIIYSVVRTFDFAGAILTALAAQALVQSGYVAGASVRAIIYNFTHTRPML